MMRIVLSAILMVFACGSATRAEQMKLAVTTSFHNSGLADILLPAILKDTGLHVQLLVVGTGQALRLGRAGDVDAILVHSRADEVEFVARGYGTRRIEIMHNDFVFVGPSSDPAGIGAAKNVTQVMHALALAKLPFVSRGDSSGTHKKELSLWRAAGLDQTEFGAWYRAVGAGMGAALNTGSAMNAYLLSDRASWQNFRNKGDLALLFAGDPALLNQYAYIPVNPDLHRHIKAASAARLANWLTSDSAKTLINGYKIGGMPMFTFNARTVD